MHSLNLKILTDFNVRSKRCWQSGRKNNREDGKPFQIMACSWERNEDGKEKQTQSSFLSRSQTYALLKQQMAVAAKSEVGFFIFFMWFLLRGCLGFLLLLGALSRCVWSFYGASANILKLVWVFMSVLLLWFWWVMFLSIGFVYLGFGLFLLFIWMLYFVKNVAVCVSLMELVWINVSFDLLVFLVGFVVFCSYKFQSLCCWFCFGRICILYFLIS